MFKKLFFRSLLQYCLSLLVFITVGYGPALAQTIALPEAAQDAINKGIMATKVPDYLLAIRYFEEARKAAPQSPEVFFNLGLAESKIPGRELRAICWFGAYLTANSAAENKVAVKEQMDMLMIKNQSNLGGLLKSLQDAAAAKPNDPNALEVVATLWANTGDISSAIKAAGLISNEHMIYKESAFADIAKIQTGSGDINGALKTLELIVKYGDPKCSAFRHIAETQFNKGDIEASRSSITAAIKAADFIEIIQNKSTALNDIAKLQLKTKDTVGAINTLLLAQKTAEQMDYTGKYTYLMWTAEIQILAGDTDNATKALLSAQKYIELDDAKDDGFMPAGFNMRSKIASQCYLIDNFIKAGLISNAQKVLTAAQKNITLLNNAADKTEQQTYLNKRYRKIAFALFEKGDLSGAIDMAEGIRTEGEQFEKNEISATIAITNAKLEAGSGNIKAAVKSFEMGQHSIDLAMSLPAYDYQRDGLKRLISESQLAIVNKLIKANDLSGAQKIADIIKDVSVNYSALDSIVKVQLLSGDFKEGQNTAEYIKDNSYKCKVQTEIAEAQIKSNDITGAKKTLERAQIFSEQIPEESKKVETLMAITGVQLKFNDLDVIKNNLQSVNTIIKHSPDSAKLKNNFWYKSSILDTILKLQLKAGDFASAFITANLNHDYYKNKAFNKIAVAYTVSGNMEEAQKTIEQISETWYRSFTERDIAEQLLKNKDVSGANKSLVLAKNYAQLIKDGFNKSYAFSQLAEVQAKAGDLTGTKESILSAKEAADSIQDPNYKLWRQVDAYSVIAEAQINIGDTAGGKTTLGIAQKIAEQEVDTGLYNREWEHINKVQQKAGIDVTAKPTPFNALAKLEKVKQQALAKQADDKQLEKVKLWITRLDDNSTYYDAALNTGPFLDITTELKSIPATDPSKYFDGLKNTADKIVKAQIVIEKMMKEIKK